MKKWKEEYLRLKELEKLKNSHFFEEATLEEIKKDLEKISTKKLIESRIIIAENTKKIIDDIPLNQLCLHISF